MVPPRRYNEVQLGEGGRVTSFREKPEDPQGNLCALCLYLLPGTIRAQLAEYLSQKHRADYDAAYQAELLIRLLQWQPPRT